MDNPTGDRWIVIPNWDKFQHYKDREPVWIKVYTELESKDEWGQLSLAARGLLVSVWLEYARRQHRIRHRDVTQTIGQKARKEHWDSLLAAGFIRFSSRRPASTSLAKTVRQEVRSKKPPSPPLGESPNGRLACPRCGVAFKTASRLEEHLENVHEAAK